MSDTLRMVIVLAVVVGVVTVRQWIILGRQVASVGEGLLKLRRLQRDEAAYVPLGAGDAFHPVALSEVAMATKDLESLGFSILGDRMEVRPGMRLGPSRWFAYSGGRVSGWFAVVATPGGKVRPVMVFFSESDSGEYFTTTRGGASPHLAQPPTLTRELIPWTDGLAAAVERHRQSVARVAGRLTPVATVEDITALLQRLRANTRQWRGAQPEDQLLEADLHAVLGNHYKRLNVAVRQYVKSRM